MVRDDSTDLHFQSPKVQASLQANTIAISGNAEEKPMTEMLPTLLNQFIGTGGEGIPDLKSLIKNKPQEEGGEEGGNADDEDVPDLVENFEDVSKKDDV